MRFFTFVLTSIVMSIISINALAADPKIKYVDGSELTLINKTIETPDRYKRVDTLRYTGFTDYQRRELTQHSAGLALCFATDSRHIYVRPTYQLHKATANQTRINTEGFCLYVRRGDKWVYAGSAAPGKKDYITLVSDMPEGWKECMLYLPNFSVVNRVEVGIDPDSEIKPIDNPFRHKIVVFGSSFTHGTCCSRPGMSYPMQLERATGLHVCDFGMSGNSKLQQSYARVLADTEADAFVFDSFSNPSAKEIEERFDDFVATIRAKHPTTPLIFMQTIYRENRNFDTRRGSIEQAKMDMGEKMVRRAMEKDPNIYFIVPDTGNSHETSVDGVHPGDYGYTLWMESIRQPILDILARYNIR